MTIERSPFINAANGKMSDFEVDGDDFGASRLALLSPQKSTDCGRDVGTMRSTVFEENAAQKIQTNTASCVFPEQQALIKAAGAEINPKLMIDGGEVDFQSGLRDRNTQSSDPASRVNAIGRPEMEQTSRKSDFMQQFGQLVADALVRSLDKTLTEVFDAGDVVPPTNEMYGRIDQTECPEELPSIKSAEPYDAKSRSITPQDRAATSLASQAYDAAKEALIGGKQRDVVKSLGCSSNGGGVNLAHNIEHSRNKLVPLLNVLPGEDYRGRANLVGSPQVVLSNETQPGMGRALWFGDSERSDQSVESSIAAKVSASWVNQLNTKSSSQTAPTKSAGLNRSRDTVGSENSAGFIRDASSDSVRAAIRQTRYLENEGRVSGSNSLYDLSIADINNSCEARADPNSVSFRRSLLANELRAERTIPALLPITPTVLHTAERASPLVEDSANMFFKSIGKTNV